MNIVLATKNKKKIEEIKRIIGATGAAIRIYTLDDFPAWDDVEEDGDTFEENAVKKALSIAEKTGMTAVADDSGLEVDALQGAPGIFSARYAGDGADDTANLEKLLYEMKDVPDNQRTARFVCCIALAEGGNVQTFMGYAEGIIGTGPRGENGFGYDPVFAPEGHDRTFAEMSDDEKNSMSHRARALKELQRYLKEKKTG